MDNAIARCGVLTKKTFMLRRKESRFYVLTNQGGLFVAKGFAAEFDSLKRCVTLTASSEVTLDRAGSGDSNCVLRIFARGNKAPLMELEAASDADTTTWYHVLLDVIELVEVVGGNKYAAQPRPLQGLRAGEEGWYLEPTGRMALYTLNAHRRWVVRDKREYDEATVLKWITGDRARQSSGGSGSGAGGVGYPAQVDAAAAVSGSSLLQGPSVPDYPVNVPGPPAANPVVDYPVQSSGSGQTHSANASMSLGVGGVGGGGSSSSSGSGSISGGSVGGGGGGGGGGSGGGGGGGGGGLGVTWATPIAAGATQSSSSSLHQSSRSASPDGGVSAAGGGTVVGGVRIGGSVGGRSGGGAGGSSGGVGATSGTIYAGPSPVMPCTFLVGRGDGDGFDDDSDRLVLRRPVEHPSSNGRDVSSGRRREEAVVSDSSAAAPAPAASTSQGRLGRVGRWRGGGSAAAAAATAAPERPSGGEAERKPLALSPAMEVLQSYLIPSGRV